MEVIDVHRTQVVSCDAPGGIAEHTARLTPITEQYQLLDWIANTIRSTPPVRLQERDVLRENAARAAQGLSMPPVRLQERDVLQENAAQTAQVLTMTSEEKHLLDTFLQDFFWKKEEGFCRKLPEGHGVRAIALQSTTNVVDTLKSIIDIRQACLGALCPDKPSRELLPRVGRR